MASCLLVGASTTKSVHYRKAPKITEEKDSSVEPVTFWSDTWPFKAKAKTGDTLLGGCLFVRDEESTINEWIAYHRRVGPLSQLFVCDDQSSKPVNSIVDYWNQTSLGATTERKLNIILRRFRKRDLVTKKRVRQKFCFRSCAKYMKSQGVDWIMFIDVDEFVVVHSRKFRTIVETLNHEPQFSVEKKCEVVPRLYFDANGTSTRALIPVAPSSSSPPSSSQFSSSFTPRPYSLVTETYRRHVRRRMFNFNNWGKVQIATILNIVQDYSSIQSFIHSFPLFFHSYICSLTCLVHWFLIHSFIDSPHSSKEYSS